MLKRYEAINYSFLFLPKRRKRSEKKFNWTRIYMKVRGVEAERRRHLNWSQLSAGMSGGVNGVADMNF